ncbi:HD-GYP domain-containing protein [Haloimpatiens sp. FM7330]|uniref:HD-GYP domain-containing protein n=1 Tax=Haloimpatiens sp. FM7330 TaxID=3298610 RepID=UPI00362EAC02
MKGMPIKLKIYMVLVMSLGVFSLYLGVKTFTFDMTFSIIFFTALGIIAESLGIRVRDTIAISVSFGIGLGAVLVFQSSVVAIIGFLSMMLFVENVDGKIQHVFNTNPYKRIFNGSAYSISLTAASIIYNKFSIYFADIKLLEFNVIGIIIAILFYIIIDTLIFFILMSIIEGKSLLKLLCENTWAILNIIAISPIGIMIAIIYKHYGGFAVILFFGPLLLARYSFKLYVDMRHMYFETIKSLSNAVEAKDRYTNGHSYRVADYAVGIARTMGLSEYKIEKIKIAAILHDIGKIGIPDTILNKPARLEDNEFLQIKEHPEIGSKILSEVKNLSDVMVIIKCHHERFDGKGYPEGRKEEEIPLESHIIAIADAYDAMTSDRPYRKAMDKSKAIDIISQEVGKQFHPTAAKAFIQYINLSL